MASTQALKHRIRSVKNTKQITKAMQLVAASKMRRSQDSTKASAPYTIAAKELLSTISHHASVREHPLFIKRDVKNKLAIVIASDKGLAGAYNSNVLKMLARQLQKDKKDGIDTKVIAIGRKAAQFATRIKGLEVVGFYEDLPDRPSSKTLYAILDTALDKFKSNEVDAVDLIFTEFISSIKQEATIQRVLPIGIQKSDETKKSSDAVYEPEMSEIINHITYRLMGAQIFQAMLEARASEHSMRMMAMKNATDNASDLVDDLTLAMNKARQGAITQELAEISGGVEALND